MRGTPRRSGVFVRSVLGSDASALGERNVQVLLVANSMGVLGFALLTPILDTLTGTYGVSVAEIGLLMSAYTAPSILSIPLSGHLSDRYGRKPLLLVGLLVLGTTGLAITATTDFTTVLGLRVLQGLGGAIIVPVVITSIGDRYTGASGAAVQGFRFSGSGVTQMVFPLIAGALVLGSWRYPFLLYGLAFPVAILVQLWLDEPTSTTPMDRGETNRQPPPRIRDLLRIRRVQLVLLVRTLPGVIWVGFLTYNSVIVVRLLDGTPLQAGTLAAVASLAFAISATQTGRISATATSRFYPLIVSNALLGVGFAIILYATSFINALLGATVMGAGFGVVLSIYRSIITDLAPTTARGRLVSLSEAFGRIVVTLTPIVLGLLVAILTPSFGFAEATRIVGIGACIVAAGGGIVVLTAARRTAPLPTD